MSVYLFNLTALSALLLAARWSRRSSLGVAVGLYLVGVLAAGGLALFWDGGPPNPLMLFFALSGHLAWWLFVHLPLALVLLGAVLWHRSSLLSRASAACSLALILFGAYAFWIEPTWLEITRYRLESAKLEEPLRICLLADLQTDRIGAYERRVVRAALAEEPDLILLAGDYLQARTPHFRRLAPQLNQLLREEQLAAPKGVFAVPGNCDPSGWEEIFTDLPVTTITATGVHRLPGLAVTGLQLADSFRADLTVEPESTFHIVLGHAPDFALGRIEADLLLAGHTHGGQFVLPGYGPLLTLSKVPRAWASGRTTLSGGRELIVSRGLGLERGEAARIRFRCRPELVVIDVVPMRAVGG